MSFINIRGEKFVVALEKRTTDSTLRPLAGNSSALKSFSEFCLIVLLPNS